MQKKLYDKNNYIKSFSSIICDPKNKGPKVFGDIFSNIIAIDCDNVEKVVNPKSNNSSADLCIGVSSRQLAENLLDSNIEFWLKNSQLLLIELKLDIKTGSSITLPELFKKYSCSKNYYLGCHDLVKIYPKMLVICPSNKKNIVLNSIVRNEKEYKCSFSNFGILLTLEELNNLLSIQQL